MKDGMKEFYGECRVVRQRIAYLRGWREVLVYSRKIRTTLMGVMEVDWQIMWVDLELEVLEGMNC